MRSLLASSGLRNLCAKGGWFSSCPHSIIPTKSIIRVELEQNMYADSNIAHEPGVDCPERISGLQVLLEGVPPLPESKLLWHCALEKLLDGTRDGSDPILGDRNRGLIIMAELDIRTEELEWLQDHMQAVGTSMAKAVSDGTSIINRDYPSLSIRICILMT